ncbi:MAG: hypothetical protein IPO21_01625 [Bacteroidales bacterium]|nr:hypothetical protein [Bacteroidales bacterium]
MLTLVKYDKIYVLFLIPFLVIGIWFMQLLNINYTEVYFDNNQMPLYRLIVSIFPHNSIMSVIVSIILVCVNGFLIIRINGINKLTSKGTYLPGILFVMFISLFPELRQLNPIIFSSVFLLLAIDRIFQTYKVDYQIKPFYESGFLIGFASLFYFNAVFFLIYLFFSMLSIRRFYWREFLAPVVGLVTVYAFLLFFYFYFNRLDELKEIVQFNLFHESDTSFFHLSNIIFFGYLSFIFIISLALTFTGISRKIIVRKIYSQFFVLFLLVLAMFFMIPATSFELIVFLGIPLSFFLTNYLLNINSVPLSEIVFIAFVSL